MILTVHFSSKFKKDLKRIPEEGSESEQMQSVVNRLKNGEKLPEKFRDHKLKGKYAHHRECHINPDLLLIYKIDEAKLILVRTGTHSELFK
ncbi:MAG TPA: type II toxin-antitoxin system YafQ family toxin [Ignavibacteria bacterium]|nr:type II toxin-antitoxin system YafQ family toxin [Ignavibacteria bacterium]